MNKPCIRITLRIPPDLHAAAVEIAKKEDRSLNWLLINLMRSGIASSGNQAIEGKGAHQER